MIYKVETTTTRAALKNISKEYECETTITDKLSTETFCYILPLIEFLNEIRIAAMNKD